MALMSVKANVRQLLQKQSHITLQRQLDLVLMNAPKSLITAKF